MEDERALNVSGVNYMNESSDSDVYMYDYNVEESMGTYYWDELLPPLLIYSFTLVIGLIGNSLIIYTVLNLRGMKTSTNVFLASLASADLLLLFICIPVKTAKVFSFSWTMGWFLCKSVHYLQNVSVFCSVLTLTAISLERYYAIVFPFRSQYLLTARQAQKVTLFIWLAAILMATPTLWMQVHRRVGIVLKAYWCHRDWDHQWRWRCYELYMLLFVLVGPMLIMVFSYTCLAFQLGNVLSQGNSFSNRIKETHPLNSMKVSKRHGSDQDTQQIIKMLAAVVFFFVVSWTPLLVTNVLWSWGYLPKYDHNPFYKHLFNMVHLLAYSNSCINPLVYGFLSKNFRQSFYSTLCPCVRRRSATPCRHVFMSHSRHASTFGDSVMGIRRNSTATYV